MALTPKTWVEHQSDLYPGDDGYSTNLAGSMEVQANSHTPEKAFGQIMDKCRPRLGVITHCHFNQDCFIPAMDAVRKYYDGPVAWAIDGMVINVRPGHDIKQRMSLMPDFAWDLMIAQYSTDELEPPKYKRAVRAVQRLHHGPHPAGVEEVAGGQRGVTTTRGSQRPSPQGDLE